MQSGSDDLSKVKAVIFDYGEVLCHRPSEAEIARLADFFGVHVDRFNTLWNRNRGLYDRGDLTAQAYWSMLAADAGVEIAPERLEEVSEFDMEMWSRVNPSMVEWMLQLKSAGLKTGILSNMQPEMVTRCRTNFAWIESFDFATFSGEVRIIKPDAAIYEHNLRGLGVTAPQALFLDDRESNIKAALALGIAAIQFQSVPQLRFELQARGFAPLPADS